MGAESRHGLQSRARACLGYHRLQYLVSPQIKYVLLCGNVRILAFHIIYFKIIVYNVWVLLSTAHVLLLSTALVVSLSTTNILLLSTAHVLLLSTAHVSLSTANVRNPGLRVGSEEHDSSYCRLINTPPGHELELSTKFREMCALKGDLNKEVVKV